MNELTDLEICKRIAEIEGVEFNCDHGHVFYWLTEDSPVQNYNPLTDDALCFRLMIKYDMVPCRSDHLGVYECVYDIEIALCGGVGSILDESPNRAICLAIIESKKSK